MPFDPLVGEVAEYSEENVDQGPASSILEVMKPRRHYVLMLLLVVGGSCLLPATLRASMLTDVGAVAIVPLEDFEDPTEHPEEKTFRAAPLGSLTESSSQNTGSSFSAAHHCCYVSDATTLRIWHSGAIVYFPKSPTLDGILRPPQTEHVCSI